MTNSPRDAGAEAAVTEWMSPHVAVFNNHINDAGRRALDHMERIGRKKWREELECIDSENNGVMAVFEWRYQESIAVSVYIALVTLFVNEGCKPAALAAPEAGKIEEQS